MVNQAAALLVLDGGAWTAAFEPAQREALATFFLDLHGFGYGVVAQVFFGLWLLPLGAAHLAVRLHPQGGRLARGAGGRRLPGRRGHRGDGAGTGFVLSEFTFVGELLLMGWLLVKGVNGEAWRARRAHALAGGRLNGAPRPWRRTRRSLTMATR